MNSTILIALAGFCFVSSITPGPNNLMLMASGAQFGLKRTWPHLLGVAGGFTFMVVLVGIGLAGLFQSFPLLQTVLKWISVIYLLFLSYKIASAPAGPVAAGQPKAKPMSFWQAVAFQWVNPKAWTMAVTAVTAYAPSPDPMIALPVTAGLFGAVNLPCIGMWAVLGTQLSRFLTSPAHVRAFNWAAAALLVATLYPVVA